MKTTDIPSSVCPQLLDGYFSETLTNFCVREYGHLSNGGAFRRFSATIDFLRKLDTDDLAYRVNNRTIRQIVEEACGIA